MGLRTPSPAPGAKAEGRVNDLDSASASGPVLAVPLEFADYPPLASVNSRQQQGRLDFLVSHVPSNAAERLPAGSKKPADESAAISDAALDLPRMTSPKKNAINEAWNKERLSPGRDGTVGLKATLENRAATASDLVFQADVSALLDAAEALKKTAEVHRNLYARLKAKTAKAMKNAYLPADRKPPQKSSPPPTPSPSTVPASDSSPPKDDALTNDTLRKLNKSGEADAADAAGSTNSSNKSPPPAFPESEVLEDEAAIAIMTETLVSATAILKRWLRRCRRHLTTAQQAISLTITDAARVAKAASRLDDTEELRNKAAVRDLPEARREHSR